MNFNENFIKAKEKMFCKNPDYNFALNELKNINKEKETICIIHMKIICFFMLEQYENVIEIYYNNKQLLLNYIENNNDIKKILALCFYQIDFKSKAKTFFNEIKEEKKIFDSKKLIFNKNSFEIICENNNNNNKEIIKEIIKENVVYKRNINEFTNENEAKEISKKFFKIISIENFSLNKIDNKFDDEHYEINKSNSMNNEIKIPKNFEFTKFNDKQIFHNHLTDRKIMENIIHKSEEIIKEEDEIKNNKINEKNDENNEKNDENKETEKENNESDKNILTEREIIKNNIYSRREFSGMEYDEESESFDNEDSENYSGNNSDYEDSSVENDEDADSEKSFSNKKSNNEDNIKIQTSYEA